MLRGAVWARSPRRACWRSRRPRAAPAACGGDSASQGRRRVRARRGGQGRREAGGETPGRGRRGETPGRGECACAAAACCARTAMWRGERPRLATRSTSAFASTSLVSTAAWPWSAASCSGVTPDRAPLSTTAPAARRAATVSAWPCAAAAWSEVEPTLVAESTSARAASSCCRTAVWPKAAAAWRGVAPLSRERVGVALLARRAAMARSAGYHGHDTASL